MSELGTELVVPQPPKKARKVRSDKGKKRGRKKGILARLSRSTRGLSRSAKRTRKKLKREYKKFMRGRKKARKLKLRQQKQIRKQAGRRKRRQARALRRGGGRKFGSGLRSKSKFGMWLMSKLRKIAKQAKRGSGGDFRNHGFTGSGKGGRTGFRGGR